MAERTLSGETGSQVDVFDAGTRVVATDREHDCVPEISAVGLPSRARQLDHVRPRAVGVRQQTGRVPRGRRLDDRDEDPPRRAGAAVAGARRAVRVRERSAGHAARIAVTSPPLRSSSRTRAPWRRAPTIRCSSSFIRMPTAARRSARRDEDGRARGVARPDGVVGERDRARRPGVAPRALAADSIAAAALRHRPAIGKATTPSTWPPARSRPPRPCAPSPSACS